jgi:hypothetical protein
MKVAPLLCAMVVCTRLALAGGAAVPSERNGPSVAAANSATAAKPTDVAPSRAQLSARTRPPPGMNAGTNSGRADDRQSTSARSEKGGRSAARDARADVPRHTGSVTTQRGGSQLARANSDRLRSLFSAQAHGRPLRQPIRRPVGPVHPVTAGGMVVRGPMASNAAIRAAPGQRPLVRTPAAHGTHAPGAGLSGGPAIGRTTHAAALDGTQMHRKL